MSSPMLSLMKGLQCSRISSIAKSTRFASDRKSGSNFPRLATDTRCRCSRPHDAEFSLNGIPVRSEEHTSELQSLMRSSYAVFCLQTKILLKRHTVLQFTNHLY